MDVDPSEFFPGRGQAASTLELQRLCTKCPVVRDCHKYRKDTGSSDGLWAGRLYRLGKANNGEGKK